jgi:spore coat polysaccharide biosynthesis protein SpsF (cytidylyltransferase family)
MKLHRERHKESSALSTKNCPDEFAQLFTKYIAMPAHKRSRTRIETKKDLYDFINRYPQAEADIAKSASNSKLLK